MDLIEKFIEYCKVYTTSDDKSETTPSSKNQLVLLNQLKDELLELGFEASIDEYGRVYGHLKGNPNYPCIGLCAHADTASECSGENVNPKIVNNYDGNDIELGHGYVLSPKDFPELLKFKGKTLITTDGSTLLGADDKAGIAIIMKLASELVKLDPSDRKPFSVLFTPDEEIGRGPEHFDKDKYKAKYAYTIDGGDIHEVSYENFNAASCLIKIEGKAIHPGDAKGHMVNALLVMHDFMSMLPPDMIPSKTEGHEGFNHIVYCSGKVEHAEAAYIIRNHDLNLLENQKKDFLKAKEEVLKIYPKAQISLEFEDEYRNMKEVIDQHPEVLQELDKAFKAAGVNYFYAPTRGGTDGATFSFKGCPCPNLGTGSRNHHGRFEYAIKEEMEELLTVLRKIFILK